MSFIKRFMDSSSYVRVKDEEVHSYEQRNCTCDSNFLQVPVVENNLDSIMTSINQYGSLTSRASTSSGCGISRQQVRLYILVKDLFLKMQVQAAVIRKRQFCSFLIFDALFATFLWILCLQLEGKKSFYSVLKSEILQYSSNKSLFDVLVVTYVRASSLLLCFDLSVKLLELLMFVNSFLSSSFLFYKIFNFEKLNENTFAVMLLVQCFVFSWIEILLFDYKIFNHIRDAKTQGVFNPEKKPLLEGVPQVETNSVSGRRFSSLSKASTASGSGFYSPYEEDSDMDSAVSETASLKAEDSVYLEKGQEILLLALDIIYSENWTKESKNAIGDLVDSKIIKRGTKVFRMQAVIDTSPQHLMKVLFDDLEDHPKWNKSVLLSKVVKKLDEQTDIIYTIAASKGPVSSRDFVVLRHRGAVGQSLVISSVSVEIDLVPVNKSHIRGENGPGCFVITPLPVNNKKCELRWLVNSNLKGWLPQMVVDAAFTSIMFNYIDDLRHFISLNPIQGAGITATGEFSKKETSIPETSKTIAISVENS